MPEKDRERQEYVNDEDRETLEHEEAVYRRVGSCDGVAECINVSREATLLTFQERGDLEYYVESDPEVDRCREAEWILFIIKMVFHFHDSKFLVDNMALRSILVADDLSLRMVNVA